MSGQKIKPLLRHAGTGVPMPWWDTRAVSLSTLCEYLDVERSTIDAYARAGRFSYPGATIVRGDTRPIVSYVPAVIWNCNGWVPSRDALAVLSLSMPDLESHIARTTALLVELRLLAAGTGRAA